jgi:hypothetical protein
MRNETELPVNLTTRRWLAAVCAVRLGSGEQ